MTRETIYREYCNARWEQWTYTDGQRIYITDDQLRRMVRQGARVVTVG